MWWFKGTCLVLWMRRLIRQSCGGAADTDNGNHWSTGCVWPKDQTFQIRFVLTSCWKKLFWWFCCFISLKGPGSFFKTLCADFSQVLKFGIGKVATGYLESNLSVSTYPLLGSVKVLTVCSYVTSVCSLFLCLWHRARCNGSSGNPLLLS